MFPANLFSSTAAGFGLVNLDPVAVLGSWKLLERLDLLAPAVPAACYFTDAEGDGAIVFDIFHFLVVFIVLRCVRKL